MKYPRAMSWRVGKPHIFKVDGWWCFFADPPTPDELIAKAKAFVQMLRKREGK